MKILQVNLVSHVASTGKICGSIAKHLIVQGHNVINCSVEGSFEQNYEYRYETDIEKICRKIAFRIFGRQQWQSVLQTRRLLKKIEEFNPDVIHLHNIHHNVVNLKLFFEKTAKKGTPIIYTLHDMWGVTGGCFHNSIFQCSEKENECKNCKMIFGDAADCNGNSANYFLKLKREMYNKQKKICFVPVSEWMNSEMNNSIISNFQRKVIHNGIDISVFRKSDDVRIGLKHICGNKKVVLSCASFWMEQKGIYDFLTLEQILGSEYQIVLVGYCEEYYKKQGTKILFWGSVTDEKTLAQLYSEADVYVSMSKCETFGLTLAEAACCGTPIIGYDNSGMGEVIDMAGGIKVLNGHVEQIAESIEAVCHHKMYSNKKSLEIIRENFSQIKMCNLYEKLYETML